MRVAALYDIHGNLPALEAVLEAVQQASADVVVVGGDVVPGPMPRECLALLQALDIPVHWIHGNGDRVVLAQRRGEDISEVPEAHRHVIRWNAEQLHDDDARAIAAWPATLRLAVRDLGEALFCHATPRNDTEIFTRLTDEERLFPVFDGVSAALAVCGHTHMQFDRRVRGLRVLNAGSVGMPFGEAGAYWLLLVPEPQLQHTHYDLDAAAARIRATDYPDAAEFAEHHLLRPPAEADMLAAFTNVPLK